MTAMPENQPRVFSKKAKLMFGQVREDAAVDLFLLQQIDQVKRVFVVASGGCTALSLLSAGDYRVDALDISQAQIALVELKATLFKELGFQVGLAACTSDATEVYEKIRSHLSQEAKLILDAHRGSMQRGLNNIGWIDETMHQLTDLFYLFVHSRKTTKKFLSLSDVSEQKEFYRRDWSTLRWRVTMAIAFNRRFLALKHGRTAMQLVPLDFAKLMECKLERALTRFPNSTNPYLWQSFLGRYPESDEGHPPYLQQHQSEELVSRISNLHLSCEDVLSWLQKQDANSIDYFGMSNVLELLPADYARALVPHLIRCGRSGAVICVRSIFPRYGQKVLVDDSGTISFDKELTDEAAERDRSLFCNFYEVYRRR
jgi:S-adenosylmethionine-diacylglycerol 3-amino-3-carboxypropyl transferase